MSQHNPHRQQRGALMPPAADGLAARSEARATLELACASGSSQRVGSAVRSVMSSRARPATAEIAAAPLSLSSQEQRRFHALYSEHFDFVFRNLRRLGVPAASTDDALQEVYLVVLRRLPKLEHNAHVKAWLFAILLRVASNHRRSLRRRGASELLIEHTVTSAQPSPFDVAARAEAAQFLHTFLSSLDDKRRAVFIMSELEQLTAPEIARVLDANLNTVYSWLRNARTAFSKALESMQAAPGAAHD